MGRALIVHADNNYVDVYSSNASQSTKTMLPQAMQTWRTRNEKGEKGAKVNKRFKVDPAWHRPRACGSTKADPGTGSLGSWPRELGMQSWIARVSAR